MPTYDPLDSERDPFKPPTISTIVGCLHCREMYDSYRIEWGVEMCRDGRRRGFWCCPIENCDGRGFGFDIFPLDPEWRDENGEKMWVEDDDSSQEE